MTKYRPYSRREFQRRFAHWVKRNLKVVLVLTAGAVGLVALGTLLFAVVFPTTAFTWWLLGVFQAIVVVVFLHLLHAAFLAHDREAIWHLRGRLGRGEHPE